MSFKTLAEAIAAAKSSGLNVSVFRPYRGRRFWLGLTDRPHCWNHDGTTVYYVNVT